ncbi:hypothetical protein K402DRAFT_204820 [Aulographum hederae CBS 113979]|uniref:Uncharacterized protein n=1 Tax=Aulographum hederae CBS 113979 TaxID=1176131 RepID=A0A6G1HCA8_9PEZI|nr:hypothetical protein K402DRAFT_204820 [Aulographum hederae CBS 113979]
MVQYPRLSLPLSLTNARPIFELPFVVLSVSSDGRFTHSRPATHLLTSSLLHVPCVGSSSEAIFGRQPFNPQELLQVALVPDDQLMEWAVYMNVANLQDADSFQTGLYTGSATGQMGAARRWSTYVPFTSPRNKTADVVDDEGHFPWIRSPGVSSRLRVIIQLPPAATTAMAILAEGVVMALTCSFKNGEWASSLMTARCSPQCFDGCPNVGKRWRLSDGSSRRM